MGKTHKADRLDSKVIHAVRHGSLENVKAVVRDALGHPEQGQLDRDLLAEALYRSCERNDLDLVQYWLEYPVSPKDRVEHAQTPLMVAKSRAVAKALVEHGAELTAKDDTGKTALMQTKSKEVAEFLIQETKRQKLSMEQKDRQGNTSLINMLLVEKESQKPLCAEIANLLIDNGANVNAEDSQGRTVLITAIWMNHVEIVQRLVDEGATVDKQDVRGRNALHHLCEDIGRAAKHRAGDSSRTKGDLMMVKTLLNASADIKYINRQENIEKRTPLHCAVFLNHDALVHALLDNQTPPKVNLLDYRQRTALHIAAKNGRHELVEKLISHAQGAGVHMEAAGRWRPLHFAAASADDSVETIQVLLVKGAESNALTDLGKTALHIAAESGNIKIVRHLLSVKNLEVTKRDVFGNSALICAAKAAHKNIVRLLAAYSAEALDQYARRVAEETKALVVDFDTQKKHGPELTPRRVFDLIYGSPRVSPFPEPRAGSDASSDSGSDSLRTDTVRWIHLPANNVFWCRGLLIKLFLEENGIDGETFQALLKSFDHQHKGKHLHARYMRPTFHHNAKAADPSHDAGSKKAKRAEHSENDNSRAQHHPHTPEHRGHAHKSKHGHKRKHRYDDSTESVPTITSLSEDPDLDPDQPDSPLVEEDADLGPSNMYVFMPYLHFEIFRDKQEMNRALRRVQPSPTYGLIKSAAKSAFHAILEAQMPMSKWADWPVDQQLILAHATSENATLQIRRTLDQFFYRTIDTSERDKDQVVHRYQKRMSTLDEPGQNANILMVDQLWMWIVNENLVVTSFPRRWNTDNDDHGVWESIYRDLQSTARRHVFDAYELATIISGHCFGWIDRREFWHDDTLFLDMFDSSIGHAMDKEVKLFKAFRKASNEASTWLRKIKGHPVDKSADPSLKYPNLWAAEDVEESQEEDRKSAGGERVFVHSLLDIGAETRLLEEVKDIRDELDMLRMIYTVQKELVPDMHKQILNALRRQHGSGARQARIRQLHQDQMRYINNPLRDIDRMDRQAARIYASITDLLDLKQKHANSIQATETQRQGNTLMVFTIVTVIFLPLSFLAAFFAINVTNFPHDQNGHSAMSIGYVSKYVFGIGVVLALICVFFAWTAEKIDITRMNAQRWIKEQLFSARLGGLRKPKEKQQGAGDGRTRTNDSNKLLT